MKVQKLATATMVALTVGGLASLGSGTAFADTPGANASGGTSTTGAVFQQNTAQQGRQNNHCASENGDPDSVDLSGARAKGRCVTTDGSFTELSEFRSGGANVAGGSSGAGLTQQNTAQRGQQNNNCANPNDSVISVSGGRWETECEDTNNSSNHGAFVQGGPADVNGGSSTAMSMDQQNTAQEGRQNNNCGNPNLSDIDISGGSSESACGNEDGSENRRTWTKGGGVEANGGSTIFDVGQQNTGQSGRQNNNCANPNAFGSAPGGSCANADDSANHQAFVKGGGAGANGGSGAGLQVGQVRQQNTAQEGRQNNNCANPQSAGSDSVGGDCANTDASANDKTFFKGAGANANGGSSEGGRLLQQNTAQEGRQNNNCANPNDTAIGTSGGSASGGCANEDGSSNHKVAIKGGGAEANGGSATAGDVLQQNTAQEGRQNNNCNNPNAGEIAVTGGRYEVNCGTTDNSVNAHITGTGGGAEADGGSSSAELLQQNTAQEGRQNNNCGNPNNLVLTLSGGRATAQCTATDESKNFGSQYR
ncbi:hypothetical protein [Streptomyces sp. NPDC048639]|uniref:hypothetical protein n=1 Tax=Streptomyces sp. NPDC048639 TaxID=3365581 RepID=UPI00371AFD24